MLRGAIQMRILKEHELIIDTWKVPHKSTGDAYLG